MYKKLAIAANSEGISLNSFVNSILKRHIVWDQFSRDMGLVPITKRTLKKLFRPLDDEAIKKIAKDVGGTVPQELIYLGYEKFNFENIMKMIELSDSRFGKVNYTVDGMMCNVNVLHGICKNFSTFLAETHQTLSDHLSLKFQVTHVDDHMICMTFEKPDISKI